MIEVRAQRQILSRTIDLFVCETRNGVLSVGDNVTLRVIKEGMHASPTISLRETEAQALMDELWHCGLRPSEGSGSAGSLAATERHLKDMQSIAIGLLRKDGMQV